MRVFYAAGCGDVLGTFAHWSEGRDDPSRVAWTYSGQFFDLRRDLDLEAYVYSDCATAGIASSDGVQVRHVPRPPGARGLAFHLAQVRNGMRILAEARRFRADVLVINGGMTHWFVLRLFPWLGIDVIPALHCALFPEGPRSRWNRWVVDRLGLGLFRGEALAILAFPGRVSDQVRAITDGRHAPIVEFLPTYRRATFEGIPAPDPAVRPFRVVFAGRVEAEKGALDLVEIAKGVRARGVTDVEFDVCGIGSALAALTLAVNGEGLTDAFRFHGYCSHERMVGLYSAAHAVIVPTRSEFAEGFNKVVVEGVLAGRPVVTSPVCPAIETVGPAVAVVQRDDLGAYADMMVRLATDPQFYREKQSACAAVSTPFCDVGRGWGEALKSILLTHREGRKIPSARARPGTPVPSPPPARERGAAAIRSGEIARAEQGDGGFTSGSHGEASADSLPSGLALTQERRPSPTG
ncbi:MAG: glycosyltransferase family 4 protein [Isosphaeraceae bacterium]|nr:glycosyltransferase family 4 protein [Isosphaeraceae bacterium]